MSPEPLFNYCLHRAPDLLGMIKYHPHYKLKFASLPPITSTFISISYDHKKLELMNKGYLFLECESRHVTDFFFLVRGKEQKMSSSEYIKTMRR
jgi:hypothetical protein